MQQVIRMIGLALATLRVTDTAKEASPVIPPPVVKSLFATAVGVGFSVLSGQRNPGKVVIEAIAVAGAASVLHDVQSAAQRFTDNQIAGVIQHARPRGPLGA